MRVELRFFASFRETVGSKRLECEFEPGVTVRDVLADLERDYPGLEGRLLSGPKLAGAVAVLVNGRNVANLDGLDTRISDGDVVGITPPVSGGSGAGGGQKLNDAE